MKVNSMAVLNKMPYEDQGKLSEWLYSLIPIELHIELTPTFFNVVEEFCKTRNQHVVFFNDRLKNILLPKLKPIIATHLEKIAVSRITTASAISASDLQINELQTPADFYQAITNYEYTKVDVTPVSNFPKTIYVRKTIALEQQIRLDLIKRAVSLWRAAEITLSSTTDLTIKDKILKFITHLQNKPDTSFTEPNRLKHIIENELHILSWEVAEHISLVSPDRVSHAEAEKLLLSAEALANWERQKQTVATVLDVNIHDTTHQQIQLDIPYAMQLTPVQQFEYNQILIGLDNPPAWYSALNSVEQRWLKENLDNIIQGKFGCPSSLTRHLPGVTNCTKHIDIIVNADHQIISEHTSHRRHTLSLTVKDEDENTRLTQQNAAQLFEMAQATKTFDHFWEDTFPSEGPATKPCALLIDIGALTPLNAGASWLIDLFPYKENNTLMQNANEAAINHLAEKHCRKVNILTTNIAVNSERIFAENFHEILTKKSEAKLIDYIRKLCFSLIITKKLNGKLKVNFASICKILSERKPKTSLLRKTVAAIKQQRTDLAECLFEGNTKKANNIILAFEALIDYLELLNHHQHINETNNKGLFANALLQIIVSHIGGTVTGGCKSAKDRWGTVLMQTTAMLTYYQEHHALPKVTDTGKKRDKFAQRFAEVFRSGHQQHMASTNVYGANGTLDGINPPTKLLQKIGIDFLPMLPKDVQQKIGRAPLKMHQLLAKSSKWKFVNPLPWFSRLFNFTIRILNRFSLRLLSSDISPVRVHPQNIPAPVSPPPIGSPKILSQLGGPIPTSENAEQFMPTKPLLLKPPAKPSVPIAPPRQVTSNIDLKKTLMGQAL
jgi:hypothetical protein